MIPIKILRSAAAEKWPESDALVVYCDANKTHLALGHEDDLLRLSNDGVGLVFLYYAIDGTVGLLDETLLKTVGGNYHDEESNNPLWTVKDPFLADHAITRASIHSN